MEHQDTALYPLLFKPVYKDYIWGGSRLDTIMQRNTGLTRCAESWEITEREDGMSIVENGDLAGISFTDLRCTYSRELLGATDPSNAFPLLIKIIDARQRLSLQVHPNNENAADAGGEPKTEMWYILDTEPGACLYAALKDNIDRSKFIDALDNNTLESCLHRLPASPGEALFVRGGRVHAIGEGCLLLEVQQNSNTTYRVYDWGRTDDNGTPRELHIDKALMVIDWNDHSAGMSRPQNIPTDDERYISLFGENGNLSPEATMATIVSCEFFCVERLIIKHKWRQRRDTDKLEIWFVQDGPISVKTSGCELVIPAGRTFLMPASITDVEWYAPQETAKLIRITLP